MGKSATSAHPASAGRDSLQYCPLSRRAFMKRTGAASVALLVLSRADSEAQVIIQGSSENMWTRRDKVDIKAGYIAYRCNTLEEAQANDDLLPKPPPVAGQVPEPNPVPADGEMQQHYLGTILAKGEQTTLGTWRYYLYVGARETSATINGAVVKNYYALYKCVIITIYTYTQEKGPYQQNTTPLTEPTLPAPPAQPNGPVSGGGGAAADGDPTPSGGQQGPESTLFPPGATLPDNILLPLPE